MYTQIYSNKYLLTSHIPIDIQSYNIIRKQEDINNTAIQRSDNVGVAPNQSVRDRQIRSWGTTTSYNTNDFKYAREQVMQKCNSNTVIVNSLKEYKEKHMNKKGNGNAGVVLNRGYFFNVLRREAAQSNDSTDTQKKSEHTKLGSPGGPEIDNKATILKDVDDALGVKKPPDVEFIFVEPYASVSFFGKFGLGQNPYGHAAVRYTLPDGTQKVMNIVGFKTEKTEMVNFVQPEEYFFGTGKFFEGCEQMGVYNRNFVSVRIENYPADKIMDMDYYFGKLSRRSREKRVDYSLLMGPVWNFLREWLPFPVSFAERGNCAFWTSKGLVEADLMSWPRPWPKSIWVELYEHWGAKDKNNVHVVSYRRVQEAELSYGKPGYTPSIVGPLYSFQNLAYRDLENFADVIVEVPPHSTKAVVSIQERKAEPSFFRHHRFAVSAATLMSVYVLYKSILRFRRFW